MTRGRMKGESGTAKGGGLTTAERLTLYRWTVQHPEAEAAFVERAWRAANGGLRGRKGAGRPLLLREDFAGTAEVAAHWVLSDAERQAMAVDVDRATVVAAWGRLEGRLGARADDLHLVCGDVRKVEGPRVDAIAALNFSVCELHERGELEGYFRACRRRLRSGGVVVVDLFGGPGSMRVKRQRRTVTPGEESGLGRIEYEWEQRSFDAARSEIDCRIHCRVGGRWRKDVFAYRWRLWTAAELREAMASAGLERVTVWSDGKRDGKAGRFEACERLDGGAEEWLAYLTGWRR